MSTRKDMSSLSSLEYKCSTWIFNSNGPLTTHIFYKALESNEIAKCYLKVETFLKYRRNLCINIKIKTFWKAYEMGYFKWFQCENEGFKWRIEVLNQITKFII